MSKRRLVACVVSVITLFWVYTLWLQDSVRLSESSTEFIASSDLEDIEYWTGLPISASNSMYKDPHTNADEFYSNLSKFKEEIKQFSSKDWATNSTLLPVLATYKPHIGWNGLFDGINQVREETGNSPSQERMHWLGFLVYQDASEPRHAIEITSRDILHKAPMHQAVWEYIIDHDDETPESIHNFVMSELCYFRDEPNKANIWISCS